MEWLLLIFALFLIVTEAVYEALDNKFVSAIIEFVNRAVVTVMAFAFMMNLSLFHIDFVPFWKVITGYVLLRFMLFDAVYNITKKLPIMFTGTTKWYDKLFSKVPKGMLAFWKVCSGIVGVCFLLGLK